MIRIRFSFGDTNIRDREIPIQEGQLLSEAVKDALLEVDIGDKKLEDLFRVVVNGKIIEPDFWDYVTTKSHDNILIAPKYSGEDGQLFKQIAVLAITLVASAYFAGPAFALTGVQLGLATAGVSIGASLLLNALIPPPVLDSLDLGNNGDFENSQMYSFSGQSNTVKRFQTVPKVYGTHRVFPNVAAAPYTQLEVDAATGEAVQYLYVVYDFGLGPMVVTDIQIGDTPLSPDNFTDYNFNLIDFNKPAVDEGDWDELTDNALSLYKGDFEGESLALALNGNQDQGDVQDTWEAIRNSSPNTDGVDQEIILNFVNPSGLYSFSSTGKRGFRQVDLDISFSRVGEDVWRKYNDPTYVSSFDAVGAEINEFDYRLDIAATAFNDTTYYSAYIKSVKSQSGPDSTFYYQRIKRNINQIVVVDSSFAAVGQSIFLNGKKFLGIVTAVASHPTPGFRILTLDRNIKNSTVVNVWKSGVITTQVEGFIVAKGSSTGRFRIKRSETAAIYSNVSFTPRSPGQYKIRVRRLATVTEFSTNVADALTWTSIATRFDRSPIATDKRHVFLELRIKATNQLNGTIQNLSGICSSVLDVYDENTLTWSKQVTSNPAWVFCDLLTGEINKKAIAKTRLHLPSILEWSEFCDEVPTPPPSQTYNFNRFECNFVLDYASTLQEVINQVAGAAQASLNLVDGKYGVLVDKLRTTPVQIFTPRNSFGFSSSRFYGPRPNALKIKYIDPEANWEVTEAIAYDDGFDETTAIETEELTSFGCTNFEQAWRFGRYMMAQNKLRQETITLSVDFEHLVCTRGDYVQITQDVMRVGGTPCRVKTVSGNTITTDDSLDIDPLLNYGYVYRGADGDIYSSTLTATLPNEFDLDGDMPAVGDLIVIGEVGSIVFDCIVKTITPNEDLTATITLVEKADAIYEAESTDTLPEYDPQLSATTNPDFAPPAEVEDLAIADIGHDCAASGAGYDYFVDLIWQAPAGSVYEYFSVMVNSGTGFQEAVQTRSNVYKYIVDPARLGFEHEFKVLAVSAAGRKLPLGAVTGVSDTPEEKTTPPSDVERLNIDITNEVMQLSWIAIPDCDAAEYLVRYSPSLTATWESSIPLLRADRNLTLASTQARTGSYFIKAIDFNGNQSVNAAVAITTIPNLFNLNVIDEITDSPDFNGGYDRIADLGGSIILANEVVGGVETAEYYEEGYYYYENLIDLGDIFTVRLQSLIQAEGYTVEDLMINWTPLSAVTLLANSNYSEWDIETQYRSSSSFNVISAWNALSDITFLNEGAAENYTEWRTFFMGDATGQVFQFRLRLISNKPSVSPRVFDATIRADMPDRLISFENLVADAVDGYELIYDYPFKGPGTTPNIQVSIDGASSGDYWTFDYRTLDGFLIKFFDSSDTQVERQFDVAIKGWGRKHSSVI